MWGSEANAVPLVGLEVQVSPEHQGTLTLSLTITSSSDTMNVLSRYVSGLHWLKHKGTLMPLC